MPGVGQNDALRRDLGFGIHAQRIDRRVELLLGATIHCAHEIRLLPEQELEKGRVRFRAIESHFGQVVVKGQKYFSEQSARNALPSVHRGGIPRSRQIARELNLANENPSRQMNVVMKASKEDEGLVDAEIQVADKAPTSWGVNFDNTGTPETGSTRLGLFYSNANVLNADHVGTLQVQVSPVQRPNKLQHQIGVDFLF